MAIKANGKTINALTVGNTNVEKVLVRQNEHSDYTTVYFAESHEENITVSGKTRPAGIDDPSGHIWYFTPTITRTITVASGTVKIIKAEAVSSSVYNVTIDGASIEVQLKGSSGNTTIDGTVKVTYIVYFSFISSYNVVQVSSTASLQL